LYLEGAIQGPPPLLEQVDYLVEGVVGIQSRPFSSASSKAFASWRSAVSNPSVKAVDWGEEVISFGALALLLPQAGKAHSGA
jgi:hypothetical protein